VKRHRTYEPSPRPSPLKKNPRLYFVFINQKLLIKELNIQQTIGSRSDSKLSSILHLPHELAEYQDQQQSLVMSSQYGQHWLIDIHHIDFVHESYALFSLRELLAILSPEEFQHVAQAWQYALFLRTHRYCGRCGETMRKVIWEMAMHCDKCSHRVYPRVSPCVIVAIHNGRFCRDKTRSTFRMSNTLPEYFFQAPSNAA